MAPTEMVQIGPSSPHPQPTTHPSSPDYAVTLSNAELLDMVKAMVAMEIASTPAAKCNCFHTPPESTNLNFPTPPLTVKDLEHPPDSPGLSPTVTLNDEQATEMANAIAAINFVPTTLSSCLPSLGNLHGNPPPSLVTETATTTADSASLCHTCSAKSTSLVAVEFAQQIMEALKSTNTNQTSPPPLPVEPPIPEQPKVRASTLEFKEVSEVWDKAVYKYKIVESITSPDEEDRFDEYIFVVRIRIDKKTQRQIHYIDIKSPGLRDVLVRVLQNVDGICLQEEKPSVERNLLYHYLLDLEEYQKSGNNALDNSTLDHLGLLVGYIKSTYTSTTERLRSLLEKHQITYDLLWTLFKPKALTYTKCFGTDQPRCVKYESGEEKTIKGGVEYYYIKARYLDFDGKVFGEASSEHAIEKFRGAKRITALEVFPLEYHPGGKYVRAHLTKYGHKFLSMMDIHLCEYEGKAFHIEKERVVEIFIRSRVVVDAAYFREENPNYSRPSIKESDEGSGWILIDLDEISEKSSSSANGNGMDPSAVKGDDLLICSPTVPGFSLSDKRWVELAVADIKEIDWKQAALDDLHIPMKKKKAVQALSEAHVKRVSTNTFDDVVEGKGQGFNVLLHGPPGVGKTLTAELLAEYLQRALMPVSAGELGTTAEAVENRLLRIFKRASRWKAVLLLDEADVLLEQRSSQDIHRNALVCVFLRTLEYYQGMMFLTTNRVGQIDDAIASRIHFKLKYDKLNLEQRTNIWRRFLGKAVTPQGPSIYSQATFDDWVRKERNGREIKNLVSTAYALATQEGSQVNMSHMDVAIAACEDFERDVNGVGATDAMRGYF